MTDEVKKLGEPLTLEQLRGMDGEPVLLVFDFELEPMISLIEYVQDADCIILTNNLGGRSEFYSDEELREYGIKVYAYPPIAADTNVGSKLDDWTAEWIKYDEYTECSKCAYWYDSPENEDDGDRPAFCPSCGRAMTPGARAMLEKRFMG